KEARNSDTYKSVFFPWAYQHPLVRILDHKRAKYCDFCQRQPFYYTWNHGKIDMCVDCVVCYTNFTGKNHFTMPAGPPTIRSPWGAEEELVRYHRMVGGYVSQADLQNI